MQGQAANGTHIQGKGLGSIRLSLIFIIIIAIAIAIAITITITAITITAVANVATNAGAVNAGIGVTAKVNAGAAAFLACRLAGIALAVGSLKQNDMGGPRSSAAQTTTATSRI